MQGRIRQVLRTLKPQKRPTIPGGMLHKLAYHAAFADPRLSGQKNRLTVTRQGLPPTILDQLIVSIATHHFRGVTGTVGKWQFSQLGVFVTDTKRLHVTIQPF
jgi:hypothetical protein